MSFLRQSTAALCLLFLYISTIVAAEEIVLENPFGRLKSFAIQIHTIAKSVTDVETRLVETEHAINALQEFLDTQELLSFQKRYLLLLECFAWDLYGILFKYQVSLFVMEASFKRNRPSIELVKEYVKDAITKDIQNVRLREILSEMALASIQRDQSKYFELVAPLDSIGQGLSGSEKYEFDLYRMILGPQSISVPH